jgi:hypothetical protein
MSITKNLTEKLTGMGIFSKDDKLTLRSMRMLHIVKYEKSDDDGEPDSFEWGTPGKEGHFKVYGNTKNPELFKKKIENALLLQQWAINEIQMRKISNEAIISKVQKKIE